MVFLEELVRNHYRELNENELYIWQYILHHKPEVQRMSIQDLAYQCNVSRSSIMRFTKKIGLEGFSELKIYLKWELSQEYTFDAREIDEAYYRFISTMKMMIETDLSAILELIYQAKRIFVYSSGAVQLNMARELRREFVYVKKVFHLVGNGDEMDAALNNVTKEDLFIIISLSGDNENAVTMAKILNGLNVPVIGIASDGNNLLSKNCQHMIKFRYKQFRFSNKEAYFGGTCHFFLISDFLFLRYLQYIQEREKNNLSK